MFKAKLWGTRGSIPTPYQPEELEERTRTLFKKFFNWGYNSEEHLDHFFSSIPKHEFGGWGGNTACVEFKTNTTQLLIDAGSGIKNFGNTVLGGPLGQGKGEIHIFFTHFHWDHLIGLPFFVPLYIPGNKIHIHAVQKDLKNMMKTLFQKPFFPVALESLASTIVYHELSPREPVKIGDMTLTPYQLDHPDPCWGYKVQHDGKTISYCVDTEAKRVAREDLGVDLPLYQDVDLMIFDSQYTIQEAIEKVDWGHAAATFGLDIAFNEKIKKIAFVHHDPSASDEKIASAEIQARVYYESQLNNFKKIGREVSLVEWAFAREGDEFIL